MFFSAILISLLPSLCLANQARVANGLIQPPQATFIVQATVDTARIIGLPKWRSYSNKGIYVDEIYSGQAMKPIYARKLFLRQYITGKPA